MGKAIDAISAWLDDDDTPGRIPLDLLDAAIAEARGEMRERCVTVADHNNWLAGAGIANLLREMPLEPSQNATESGICNCGHRETQHVQNAEARSGECCAQVRSGAALALGGCCQCPAFMELK